LSYPINCLKLRNEGENRINQRKYSFEELMGKKTLIIGDVRTGKTKMTFELLKESFVLGFSGIITVIDMAPKSELADGNKVGGRLTEIGEIVKEAKYMAPSKVETPRLKATSAAELQRLVRINMERIKPLVEEYLSAASPILFINDISIFLQSGGIDLILRTAALAETFIVNGYYGKYFPCNHGTGVSKLEKESMDLLASKMDAIIKL